MPDQSPTLLIVSMVLKIVIIITRPLIGIPAAVSGHIALRRIMNVEY